MEPIFIHTMFRTGSTYIWDKFRKDPNCVAYYEPFHNELKDLKKPIKGCDKGVFEYLKHPIQDRPYFAEFEPVVLSKGGVKYFKEDFIAREFCYNGENTDLKKYIDLLIDNALPRKPVFEFNRSSMRTKWFKEMYPDSFNVYLVRDPRDTFMSYWLYTRSNNNYFLAMNLIYLAYNFDQPIFSWLVDLVGVKCKQYKFDEAIKYYSDKVKNIPNEIHYLLFYTIWYSSLYMNTVYADLILDINRLSTDVEYRNYITKVFGSFGCAVKFEDCAIPKEDPVLTHDTMTCIEKLVQQKIDNLVNKGSEVYNG